MMTHKKTAVTFLVLLAGTMAMMCALGPHGAPLRIRPACGKFTGIGALETTFNAGDAKAIVDAWAGAGGEQQPCVAARPAVAATNRTGIAREDIAFDYAFIALYSTTLALAGFLGAALFGGWFGRLGAVLGWAMWLAGLLDVAENIGMTAELNGNYGVAPLVGTVSSLKWILAAIGLVYGLIVLFPAIYSILRQDGVHGQEHGGR